MKPISPDSESLTKQIPEYVISAVNTLIQRRILNGTAVVKQKEIVGLALQNALEGEILDDFGNIITKGYLFDNRLLDIEDTYTRAGWAVKYDKPGYCEDYDAYFIFAIR